MNLRLLPLKRSRQIRKLVEIKEILDESEISIIAASYYYEVADCALIKNNINQSICLQQIITMNIIQKE
ncbi:hypothetical protein pb186bvf_008841 [Paramecium bursaria]